MKKRESFCISLEVGIATAFITLVLVTSISLSIIISSSVKQTMREDLQKQLHNVVSVGSLLIQGDEFELLVHESQVNSPEYLAIQKKLQEIRDSSLDIRYLYTMRLTSEEKLAFIVDAEDTPGEMSLIGEEYDSPTDLLREIFANPTGSYVENTFHSDQWGTWISGYAPIFNSSGQMVAILGADMSAQKVVEYERSMLVLIFLTSAVVSIIVSLIGMQFSNRITKPLKLLEEDLNRIRRLELDTNLQLHTIFKEVRSVHSSVNNMKKGLRSFKKYVPASLVRQLIDLEKEATLAMERKELTVFFSDIADFTTISEKTPLDKLGNTMVTYLTNLTQIIHKQEGTIDKYIGDSIMAFWGAPLEVKNHALLACEAALECQQFLQDFNAEMSSRGEDVFVTRIGIHTGEILVGNIGAEDRLNYTVIGDPANVASRLEGLNKHYGTLILISEVTQAKVKDVMLTRIVDKAVVKGRNTGLVIYELVDRLDRASREVLEFSETYNQGMEHYFNHRWSLALEHFYICQSLNEADPLVQAMIERCQGLLEAASDQA
ncbi:adenylate/guanylate cyclase domain-containing protein [Heliorestis acidaminivorans]|uniref:Adenylate/guanylate cyclase domain-containing protein n=1 Tax=Heliorestis acidaminivorans TaxID=553427 RepID=A0A6I0ESS2_9FIRM|nr:adenylate/guanylate cyclase domain-containing protein [Heliorestis acidaminivorans]KAB2951961.1 adenylate/guanylate cyclase domain-containing protein [Heliorestis acidaminivorans]